MTIHAEHPFADPDPARDPVRRLRGRLTSGVTLWTTGALPGAEGLTVSSVLVAPGAPAAVVGLVDPDSDLGGGLALGTTLAVSVLEWRHRALADAFAGVAPAPGGLFRQSAWQETAWGPVPEGAVGWAGATVTELGEAGWSLRVTARIDHAEVAPGEGDDLVHVRGRYRRLAPLPGSRP